jgi:peroxiredoxin
MKPGMQERLDARRDRDLVWKARYDTLVAALRASGAGSGALKAGDACPDFLLVNAEGRPKRLTDFLAKGPVVLSFYRGQWCPYCVTELEALREAAPEIAVAGASLVALTAEDRGGALSTKRKHGLDFEILCDFDNGVSLNFGLVFRVTNEIRRHYREAGIHFPLIYGNESWFLPIPATYVVGKDGVIRLAYVNPEFRQRLDPVRILEVLSAPAAAQ